MLKDQAVVFGENTTLSQDWPFTDCFVIDNSGEITILEIGSIFEGVIGCRSGFTSVEDAEEWARNNNIVITGEADDYSWLCK